MFGSALNFQVFLVSAMILVLDAGTGLASVFDEEVESKLETSGQSEIFLPPLMCGDEVCPAKDRMPNFTPSDASAPVMEFGWWNSFWSDSDNNGVDDRLQRILSGERESVSRTSIIGDDGRSTVAIIVHYAWHPGQTDISSITEVISSHGWEENGSWFMVMDSLDAIVLDHVPVSSIIEIWNLEGVVLVEEQNVIVPYLDKATRGSKVRTSGVFEDAIRGLGFHGDGIVIAILDTGVDNEHFSLDDFSDENFDNEKEPDDLTDPKWVAGCDATRVGGSGCSEEDPDDGDGHGTHVAGIALGTGDSSKVVQGYAPGSYLVDVKVMQDFGGGNSQQILAGLQWVINNRDTDWGNNESSRGIQVVSMSFGRASSFGDDNNDDGSSAEGQLVNQASESGLVCLAAIGNDGANNVNSVGAADTAITVGWLDDKNTIPRNDDVISSSSNYGPRSDDGDQESYDEMKPWVVAPGSNINSAQHAQSTTIIPGSGDANRAEDDYTQLSGTSMSTPAVAGLVAIMLQIGEERGLDFMKPDAGIERTEAIRSYLMKNSEFREGWKVDGTLSDMPWNTKYGFGIIDGASIAEGIFGATEGDCVEEGPGFPRRGEWVDIESPAEFSWVIEGESYNLRGHINEHGEDNGSTEEILAKIQISYKKAQDQPRERETLVCWKNPIGLINWTVPFEIPELPEEYVEVMVTAEVAAKSEFGKWSNITEFEYPVGRLNLTLEGPSGNREIKGVVDVSGEFQTVGNATIQWRLDNEEWEDGAKYSNGMWTIEDFEGQEHPTSNKKADGSSNPAWKGHPYCAHMFREYEVKEQGDDSPATYITNCKNEDDYPSATSQEIRENVYGWKKWSFDWDTNQLKDGEYRLSVRLLSGAGVITEEIRRFVTIDNVPPTPDLVFVSKSISVQEFGIPISESYVNNFLEVRATIRNTGDKAASDVGIILEEEGSRKDEYVISQIDTGDFIEVVLFWNPSTPGNVDITIIIDPLGTITELDESNNLLSGSFKVLPRPEGVDIAIRPGSVATNPVIPRPFEQTLVEVRIDNLGSTQALGIEGSLELLTERGWVQVSTASAAFILGGSFATLSFLTEFNESGPHEMRVNAITDGDGDLDWSNNIFQKTILVDRTTLTGPSQTNLGIGESPVEVILLDEEEGGILVSEKDGSLFLYKLTPSKSLVSCTNVMEDRWSGDLVVRETDDSMAHMIWTRRYLDSNGFLMQTLSYSTIDPTCRMSPIQDLLEGIPLSDGKYWGIDMDIRDEELIVSGYYRDRFNGGTMEEVVSIFILSAEAPISSSDWILNPDIISDLDIPASGSDPVSIEFGHERAHLLYQNNRNDSTGKDRLGLWYAHGDISQESWPYKKAVGDQASSPQMTVIVEDEEELIVSLWREGSPQNSELVAQISSPTFTTIGELEERISARGLSNIEIIETERGVQVIYDFVGPSGPRVEYGIIDYENLWIGLSNSIVDGQLDSISRSHRMGETVTLISSPNGWSVRSIVDDGGGTGVDQTMVERVRISLGLDESSFEVLVIGVAFAVLILGAVALVTLSAQGLRWARKRRSMEDENSVLLEDDVIDVIDNSDLSVDVNEVEIIGNEDFDMEINGSEKRKVRRQRRMDLGNDSGIVSELAPVTGQPSDSLPMMKFEKLDEFGFSVVCAKCNGKFIVGDSHGRIKCPVCGERMDF